MGLFGNKEEKKVQSEPYFEIETVDSTETYADGQKLELIIHESGYAEYQVKNPEYPGGIEARYPARNTYKIIWFKD